MRRKGLMWVLALVVSVLMVAPVFAVEWTASGNIQIGYRLYRNLFPEFMGAQADSNIDNWVQRVDLGITATASENLKGYIRFFIDAFPWPWGTYRTGQNAMGYWTSEQVTVESQEAYIDFKIPALQTPTWVRAGVQYHVIRPVVFLNVPGPGINLRSTCKLQDGAVTVGGGWGKIREYDERYGSSTSAESFDVNVNVEEQKLTLTKTKYESESQSQEGANLFYGFAEYSTKGNKFGVYAAATGGKSWVRKKMSTSTVEYVFELIDDEINVNERKERIERIDLLRAKGTIWWFGLYSDGKVGPFNYSFDAVLNTGSEKVGSEKTKYNGWMARAELVYPYERYRFGLGGVYVSGQDYKKENKVTDFVNPFGSQVWGPAGDSLVVISGWNAGPGPVGDVGIFGGPLGSAQVSALKLAEQGWPGIWGVRLFADYKVVDWLTLLAQVSYWGDTAKHGDTFEGPGKDESSIGFEVDLGAAVNIYKNLTLRSAFGYLFKGSALDMKEVRGKKIDDPYAFIVTLFYTF
ncbi:MAG: hypothetical protein QW707_03140 [Candidatus Bathyarchaeia archaeon]